MSTQTTTTPSESKARAAEFAKNYPMVSDDGLWAAITVGNIGEYKDRDIVNLCLRTPKSGANNASISYPKIWNKAKNFRSGMLVDVQIVDGFIKKITPSVAKAVTTKKVSAAEVNKQVGHAMEEQEAEEATQDVVNEALSDVPASEVLTDDKPF